MITLRRAGGWHSRSMLLALLLVSTLVLATMLAYAAHDAARSHRATAERALHDYAAVAAWELVAGVNEQLQSVLGPAFAPIRVRAVSPYELLPAPNVIAATAASTLRCGSPASDSARFYFRFDFRDRSLAAIGTEPSATMRAWLIDTITAHGRGVYQPDWSYAIIVGGAPATPRIAIAYAVKYAEHRAPVAAYGFSTCADIVGPALFSDVLSRRPLLPTSVTGGMANDSLIAVMVTGPSGAPVFRSGAGVLSPFFASAPLDQAGKLSVRATIRSRAVDVLALGALPPDRLPMLVGLLMLTAVLILAAVAQMRRENELERLRADFISSVSHELRTPLSQILLFAETLNLGRVRTDGERQAASEVIVQEGRRLMHLVDNILHFSRAERRMVRLDPGPIDLGPAVRAIVDDWLPLAQAADAEVRIDVQEDVVALADRSALRQMLLNLLDNAVKYGDAGQAVTVGVGTHRSRARLWVEDQGDGIPPRERAKVWDAFYRLERHANSVVAGSGIGLYVVRELARMHGGDAFVEDAATGGARFVVELAMEDGRSEVGGTGRSGVRNASMKTGTSSERDEHSPTDHRPPPIVTR
jgi:signal transduction histidine kinase